MSLAEPSGPPLKIAKAGSRPRTDVAAFFVVLDAGPAFDADGFAAFAFAAGVVELALLAVLAVAALDPDVSAAPLRTGSGAAALDMPALEAFALPGTASTGAVYPPGAGRSLIAATVARWCGATVEGVPAGRLADP